MEKCTVENDEDLGTENNDKENSNVTDAENEKGKNTNPDNEKEAENTPNEKEIVLHCDQQLQNNYRIIQPQKNCP